MSAKNQSALQKKQFTTMYSDHYGWLHRWLRGKLGCTDSAADIAHDTYLRLLAAETLPQPEQSRQYLTQIAKGLVVDLFRRRSIETAYLDTIALLPEPEAPSPETQQIIIETLLEIDQILNGLPEKMRRALLMCKLDGLSYREIAEQLEVSVSSVEKYIATALQACYLARFGTDI